MGPIRSTFLKMLIILSLAVPVFLNQMVIAEPDGQVEPVLIPVLVYHRVIPKVSSIYDYTPEQLEEHLKYLRDHGYTPITALQMVDLMDNPEQFPPKPVVLTFDDGHKSHYANVYPLLLKYGFKGTFFIYSNIIAAKSEKLLTWDELREMRQNGMDIQSHTKSHPFLTRMFKNETEAAYQKRLIREIQGSKQVIEAQLEQKVELLAYPYGWFNQAIENLAVQAGYRGIFTVNWGSNSPGDNCFKIKRRVMENNFTKENFETILTAPPLPVEIICPEDAGILTKAPEIKFKILNPEIDQVEIKVRSRIDKISRNEDDLFVWSGLQKLTSGYYMIIIKGYDRENRLYINSWGFDYR
jgi:peptidoglycan/xylan/chitin deacetylase (PgdA/CDA1 family)